jgi:hypothetical protein
LLWLIGESRLFEGILKAGLTCCQPSSAIRHLLSNLYCLFGVQTLDLHPDQSGLTIIVSHI